jgi:hypothetical protein
MSARLISAQLAWRREDMSTVFPHRRAASTAAELTAWRGGQISHGTGPTVRPDHNRIHTIEDLLRCRT